MTAPTPDPAVPWTTREIDDTNVFGIYDAGGHLVADVYPIELEPSGEARARFLVQAANSHDALVEALERVNQLLTGKFRGDHIFTTITVGPAEVALIRSALSAARGAEGAGS